MQTITQPEPTILMSVWIADSARRHLKAEAAKAGMTMGDFLTDLLRKHGGYEPPAKPATDGNEAAGQARQASRPTAKQS